MTNRNIKWVLSNLTLCKGHCQETKQNTGQEKIFAKRVYDKALKCRKNYSLPTKRQTN